LSGEELSVLALTDGRQLLVLPPAQDHKRLGEGDTGPNTGGMGAYCPVALGGDRLIDRVRREVFEPTLQELARRGATYSGVLYAATARDQAGTLRTAGGRVLSVTGLGGTVGQAARASRTAADRIAFDGKTWRRDIAWRELRRAGAA